LAAVRGELQQANKNLAALGVRIDQQDKQAVVINKKLAEAVDARAKAIAELTTMKSRPQLGSFNLTETNKLRVELATAKTEVESLKADADDASKEIDKLMAERDELAGKLKSAVSKAIESNQKFKQAGHLGRTYRTDALTLGRACLANDVQLPAGLSPNILKSISQSTPTTAVDVEGGTSSPAPGTPVGDSQVQHQLDERSAEVGNLKAELEKSKGRIEELNGEVERLKKELKEKVEQCEKLEISGEAATAKAALGM
jgi:predicted RNase H-like nuclease (RuvC/YqgF family)